MHASGPSLSANCRFLVNSKAEQIEGLEGRELLPVLATRTLTPDVCTRNKLIDAAKQCSIIIWSPNGFLLHGRDEE